VAGLGLPKQPNHLDLLLLLLLLLLLVMGAGFVWRGEGLLQELNGDDDDDDNSEGKQ
jgi:hypothetical protein